MRLEFKFRHTPHSDELTDFIEEKLSRLEKFERKPVKIECTFTQQKQTCRVDLHAHGKQIELHAHSEGNNFLDAAEAAIDKMSRQLERKKQSRTHQRRDKPASPQTPELPTGFNRKVS